MNVVLKKRGAVVEDFEEEDFSEFEESNNTDDIQTETSQLAGQSKADQFQTAKTKLDAILNQSHVSHSITQLTFPTQLDSAQRAGLNWLKLA